MSLLQKSGKLLFRQGYQEDLRYEASIVESNYGLGCIEGEKKGREEGREQGALKERIENARKMKQLGVDVQLIVQITGLSLEEIDVI